jgi:hypothetical protein
MIDTKEIESTIKDLVKTKVEGLVSEVNIKALIASTVDMVIAERVTVAVSNHLSTILKKGEIEKDLITKFDADIKTLISQEIKNRTANAIARIDIATEMGYHIDAYLDEKITAASLPVGLINHQAINWEGFTISSDVLTDGVIKNFSSLGIQDVAGNTELTVADQVVIIENTLVVRNAEVKENFVANDVSVENITINNQLILNENINKQFVSLIKDTFQKELANQTIDIVEKPIQANGKEVLTENALGSSVISSNLRKLGRLTELNVAGIAQFNDTLLVTDSGKIGINTIDPEGVLTLWDDDSELTIRRYKKKNMYVGTMRDTDLSLGVNGDVKLAIRKDGTVEMNSLELNGMRISVAKEIPSGVGKPGELVLMENSNEDEPWAYRCIGGNRWKAIK